MLNISVFAVFTHRVYGYVHPTTSSVRSLLTLDRVCLNFAVDPVNVMGDTGVDPGLILLPAPVAPADHAHQGHLVIVSTDERAARVSLWVQEAKWKERGREKRKIRSSRVISIDLMRTLSVKMRHSHLAGIVQASGVSCTQHVGGNRASRQHIWDAALFGPQADVTSLNTLRVLCRNCGESV